MKAIIRQYLANKPHKWGFKLFVLSDSYGFSYRFEVYGGAGDNVVLPGAPDLGAAANVVVRLSRILPDFRNHIMYFDNFYTSLPLLTYLRSRGMYFEQCQIKKETTFCYRYICFGNHTQQSNP